MKLIAITSYVSMVGVYSQMLHSMSMVAGKHVHLIGDVRGGHTLRHSRQILPLQSVSQQPEPHWAANDINADPVKSRKAL